MASRKQISSSFTVSVVEDGVDGASDQQIYKLSSTYPWSGGTPSGGSGDNDVPSGWSRTVLGVSESNKYCYISSRTKSNGTWSAWSTPVLYSKLADDGDSMEEKTVYTVADTQPSAPTGTTPAGWLDTQPSVVFDAAFAPLSGYSSFGYADDGRRSASGMNEGEDELYVERLSFNTKDAGQVIAIEMEASTEPYYDYINVGALDTAFDPDAAVDDSRSASGTEKKVVLTTVPTAGAHFIVIVFRKDDQDYDNNDVVYYRLVTTVWKSEGTLKNGVLQGTWSIPVRTGGVVRNYSLLPSHSSLSFHRNALDQLTPSSYSVYCGYKVTDGEKEEKYEGNASIANRKDIGPRWLHIYRRIQSSNNVWGSWVKHSSNLDPLAGYAFQSTSAAIEFALSSAHYSQLVSDANIVERIVIPALRDGQKGTNGASGRMYYPAGEYASDVTYTNDGNACPMVHHSDEYWYLDPDVSSVTGVAPSDTSGNPWKKAENYGLVITEALFAAFAKFGSFIVSGDFFISQYGTLFTSSSDAEGTPVNQIGQQYQSKVCYTYFRSTDPMAEKPSVNTYPKFRPRKVINALTGEEYMAEGNVRVENDDRGKVNVTIRGTIKADNLYQNMCLFSGGSSGIVYSTITYYIKQKPTIGMGTDYDMDCATAAEVTVNTNFWNSLQVNGYYTEQEITDLQEQYTAGGITPSFIEHNDYATKYFWLKCTGLSNLIQMIPTVSGYGYDTNYPVKLPRAVDFPNKVIEITGWSRVVDERQMYIGCVDDKMRGGIDVNVQAGRFDFYGNPTARITIMTGAVYKFQSISLDSGSNYYWVCLGKAR